MSGLPSSGLTFSEIDCEKRGFSCSRLTKNRSLLMMQMAMNLLVLNHYKRQVTLQKQHLRDLAIKYGNDYDNGHFKLHYKSPLSAILIITLFPIYCRAHYDLSI